MPLIWEFMDNFFRFISNFELSFTHDKTSSPTALSIVKGYTLTFFITLPLKQFELLHFNNLNYIQSLEQDLICELTL